MKKVALLSAVPISILLIAAFAEAPSASLQRSPKRGMATLYSKDPLLRTYSFTHMDHGTEFEDWDIHFVRCELDFDWMRKNHFTAGILEGEKGIILDLGERSLPPYGIPLFYSLMRKERKFYAKRKPYSEEWRELEELGVLFGPWEETLSYAPVAEGHTYCIRVFNQEEGKKSKDIMVKLLVVEFVPNQHTTFRWEML